MQTVFLPIYDKNSVLVVLDIIKKGVVCQEKKPQNIGCFLKPSGGEPDRKLL
jgi:hypothetical protein